MLTFIVQFWVDLSHHQRRHQFSFSTRPVAPCRTARAERLLRVSSTAHALRPVSSPTAHTRHFCSTIRLCAVVAIALTYYVSPRQPPPFANCVGRPRCALPLLHGFVRLLCACLVSIAYWLLELNQPLPTNTHSSVDFR